MTPKEGHKRTLSKSTIDDAIFQKKLALGTIGGTQDEEEHLLGSLLSTIPTTDEKTAVGLSDVEESSPNQKRSFTQFVSSSDPNIIEKILSGNYEFEQEGDEDATDPNRIHSDSDSSHDMKKPVTTPTYHASPSRLRQTEANHDPIIINRNRVTRQPTSAIDPGDGDSFTRLPSSPPVSRMRHHAPVSGNDITPKVELTSGDGDAMESGDVTITDTHAPYKSGVGDSTYIVGDLVIYGERRNRPHKVPVVSRQQTCIAKLEVASTGEIGVMLWARKHVFRDEGIRGRTTIGTSEGDFLRHGWVRKGHCLKRIVKELLKDRAVHVEVKWTRRYFWRKWETSGFDGDITWASYNSEKDFPAEYFSYEEVEDDSD